MSERTDFIRTWWRCYYHLLASGPASRGLWQEELNRLTDRGQQLGIIKAGVPMPKDGAEDLARDCDDVKKHMERQHADQRR